MKPQRAKPTIEKFPLWLTYIDYARKEHKRRHQFSWEILNMSVEMLHNPRCSKSRQTLAILEENGIEPIIVDYLSSPPSLEKLRDILRLLDMQPRDLMRKGEAEYKENNFSDAHLTTEQLLQAMVDFPKLIERPIVLANGKARIGRPPESVLEII